MKTVLKTSSIEYSNIFFVSVFRYLVVSGGGGLYAHNLLDFTKKKKK